MSQSFWDEFVDNQRHLGDKSVLFNTLRQCSLIEQDGNNVTINCQNQGVYILMNKRKPVIEDMLSKHTGQKISVEFVLEQKQPSKPKEAPLLEFEPSTDDIATRSGLNPKYKFDNFAVSSANQVAFAAAQAVAKDPGRAYNPLFLHGSVGVGKTHLAHAIGIAMLEANNERTVFFCPSDQFTNELIESIREKNTARFRRKYRPHSLIIIDDIQFIAGKQSVQEEFFHTFNSIVSAGGQVILTSDRPPSEIKNLEDRLKSRFSGGLIVDLQKPDFELRSAILLIKAEEKNINIEIDAARAIAEIVEDTRALEGTLLSIYAKTLASGGVIDLVAVDDFFQEKVSRTVKRLTPQDVIKAVCSYYNIKQSHLKGPSRMDKLALARQMVMYILRREFNLKLEEIAAMYTITDSTEVNGLSS